MSEEWVCGYVVDAVTSGAAMRALESLSGDVAPADGFGCCGEVLLDVEH